MDDLQLGMGGPGKHVYLYAVGNGTLKPRGESGALETEGGAEVASQVPDGVANLDVVIDRLPKGMLQPGPSIGQGREGIAFFRSWLSTCTAG